MDQAGKRLGVICLALPEAAEMSAWGDPTFRIRDKISAMLKRGDGRPSVRFKAPDRARAVLIGADPERFFQPPYVGHRGRVGMRLDIAPDSTEVDALVQRSYRMTALKKLVAVPPE